MQKDKKQLPLDGIRILEWTAHMQGPIAARMLGDLGAEVIKVEDRDGGDPGRKTQQWGGISQALKGGRFLGFEHNNLNKKSITLDMRKEEGKEIIYELVRKTDVFLSNYRKGQAQRLGLAYETLTQYNSQLVYARATGFGSRGPDSEQRAYDYTGQARSGLMAAIGEPGTPPTTLPAGSADQVGATVLAYGVLAALLARDRLGMGQEVEVSLLGSMIHLQSFWVTASLALKQDMPKQERAKVHNPLWNHYRCADNKWIAFAVPQPDRHWHNFCNVVGIGALEHDPRFENQERRGENCQELIQILDKAFAARTQGEWKSILEKDAEFAYALIGSISDLATDPQVIENEYLVDFDHPVAGTMKLVSCPVQFSKTPAEIRLPAPELGQHTEETLNNILGYSHEKIAQLRKSEVI
ncbi:CaiB/BaiF CoA transferase family protein [Chloroflexota bacterium]